MTQGELNDWAKSEGYDLHRVKMINYALVKEGLVRAKKLQSSTNNQAGYFWVVDNKEFRMKLEKVEEQFM